MKIQVGIGTKSELDYFLRMGAAEFYCGFGSIPGHLYGGVNFQSVKDIVSAIRVSHNYGRKFYIAANEIQSQALTQTVAFIKEMASYGVDGAIIRDIAILDRLGSDRGKLEYILSSLSPCYNASALRFYKSLGITRFALPEHLLPSEAEGLIKNGLGIGTEMFLMVREYCVVLNGLCYLKQFNGQCLCRKEFETAGGGKFRMALPGAADHFSNLYDFHSLGVGVLKIGRHPTRDYSRVIFNEALAINKLLESGMPKKDFVGQALKYHGKIGSFMEKCLKR